MDQTAGELLANSPTIKEYYETTFDRWVMVFLFVVLVPVGWMLLAAHNPRLALAWLVFITSMFIVYACVMIRRKKAGPILIIGGDFIVLIGIHPGYAEWLSGWHREEIRCVDIDCMQIGQIRELVGGAMHLPPLRVPCSSSGSMQFLWVTYHDSQGRIRETYYPHLPRIRNYREAMRDLDTLARACSFRILWHPPFLAAGNETV